MMKRIIKTAVSLLAVGVVVPALMAGCSVSYSFSGASVNYALSKTFSISYFNNIATMVTPMLSPLLTDELTRRLVSQTRLTQVQEEGDLSFTGEITDYQIAPIAVSGDEYATKNRLTITVRLTFVNKNEPQFSFTNRVYREYEDYDTNLLLSDIEPELVPQIVEKLVENIFNDALSNW